MNRRGKNNKCFFQWNFFPKNRRGSHVEVIISFIIFITFIIFLFATVKYPVGREESKKNIFSSIESGIIEKISNDVTTITVNVADGVSPCISLNNLLGNSNIGRNIVVKDNSGNILQSSLNGNSLNINRINLGETLLKVYYSPEFEELGTSSGCLVTGYNIGFTKTSKYPFENKFLELMNEDYQTLNTELNVPKGVNFTYGIILSNATTIEKSAKELSTNVYVREISIEYIDLDGNIKEGYLKTTIW
jgi:hypothetical protein